MKVVEPTIGRRGGGGSRAATSGGSFHDSVKIFDFARKVPDSNFGQESSVLTTALSGFLSPLPESAVILLSARPSPYRFQFIIH